MTQLLRPPSSINDLRTQIHLGLSQRLQNLDLTQLLVYTLGNAPASVLPYISWQFNVEQLAAAASVLGVPLATVIANALSLYKIMGTPQSIYNGLAMAGISATLQEGQSSWGGSSYPASQGWAVFRVSISGYGSAGLIGPINGANRVFTLASTPNGSSLRLYYNGIILRPTTDYTVSGLTVTLTFTPPVNSILTAYSRTGSNVPLYFDAVVPTVSGGNLILPQVPIDSSLLLYRNGVLQTGGLTSAQLAAVATMVNFLKPARCKLDSIVGNVNGDYTISGATITPSVAPGSDHFIAWGAYAGIGVTPHYADYIVPTGTVNGINKTFTLPQAPNPVASLQLFDNITLTRVTDYTLTGTTLVLGNAPGVNDAFFAFYRY